MGAGMIWNRGNCRRFRVQRGDETVAVGSQYPSWRCTLEWMVKPNTLATYTDMTALLQARTNGEADWQVEDIVVWEDLDDLDKEASPAGSL